MKYIFQIHILFILSSLLFVNPVYAYIDPGTTGSVFGAISSILPAIFAFLGFLFLPIKRLIKYIISKLKRRREKEIKSSENFSINHV